MRVLKRGSRGYEEVRLDKITERISQLCFGLSQTVDPVVVSIATVKAIYDGISTEELDHISASIADSMKLVHPDYGTLAGRICISNLHKTTPSTFSAAIEEIAERTDLLNPRAVEFVRKHANELDAMIIHKNDYQYNYLAYETLSRSYLLKDPVTNKIIDRPQYMCMRVAIALFMDSEPDKALKSIQQAYTYMSELYYTHATPTLFNACSKLQQMVSCFLCGTADSIEEIMRNITNIALISKSAGGCAVHMHNIRCCNQLIRSTNGKSSGLPRQLKIYNELVRTFNQGGKRLGACAIYVEPWHGDIFQILEMKLNINGEENSERTRDLFYALWIPDLFFKRVRENGKWSLFSENTAPGLSDLYDGMQICKKCGFCCNRNYVFLHYKEKHEGRTINDGLADELLFAKKRAEAADCKHEFETRAAFTELYERYEAEGRATRTVRARDILDALFKSLLETGTPYIGQKDHVNRKSNQSSIGTIKSSNLCMEIMEWSSEYSYATCTLASINLRRFIKDPAGETMADMYDFAKLHEITRFIVRSLDRVIETNVYPVQECVNNAKKFRPVGIGIQGLADVFCILNMPYLSDKAYQLDVAIMETIYHAAVTESVALARTYGAYSEFEYSPAAQGKLQFDLWLDDIKARQIDIWPEYSDKKTLFSGMYDWDSLKKEVMSDGMRNSLLVALMPTVSTSQIMGNNESFEAYHANIYTKSTLSGKNYVINDRMLRKLIELGIWSDKLKDKVIINDGSVAAIDEIPAEVREVYKTVWELPQRELMRRAAIRGAFVDQSQSLNCYLREPTQAKLRSLLLSGDHFGLKCILYYLRTPPGTSTIKAGKAEPKVKPAQPMVCKREAGCMMCDS